MGRLRRAAHLAMQRSWFGLFVAGVLIVVLAELKAQPVPSDDVQVLAADGALADAMRAGDKSIVRRLLALQFTLVDDNGQFRARKDFLADLKGVAVGASGDATVKIYGLVAMVTGHRKSVKGNDVFFLDIWVKQKRAWRALTMQDVVVAAAEAPNPIAEQNEPDVKAGDCVNPCLTVPYRVRSPAEQDIVNAFLATAKAAVAHDAGEWSKHIADEFVQYRSGHAPISKSGRIAAIEDQKKRNIPAFLTPIQIMRLWVFGDGAAMISTNGPPDDSQPQLRVARVWVKRNGQWQMVVSVQTVVKNP